MEGCDCCTIIGGGGSGFRDKKYVVELEGGWVLNHCGAEKTCLGYLILQTKCHRVDFGELSAKEVTGLGTSIQRINWSLRQYWSVIYSGDSIERVYIAYFNETPFIKRLSGQKILEASHVHMHLLPRTKRMGGALDYNSQNLAWCLVYNLDKLPSEYINISGYDIRVINLMNYLRGSLGS